MPQPLRLLLRPRLLHRQHSLMPMPPIQPMQLGLMQLALTRPPRQGLRPSRLLRLDAWSCRKPARGPSTRLRLRLPDSRPLPRMQQPASNADAPSSTAALPAPAAISSALPALPDSSPEARAPSILRAPRPADLPPAVQVRVPASASAPVSAPPAQVVSAVLVPAVRAVHRRRKLAVRSALLRAAVAVDSSSTLRLRKAR